MNPVVLQELMNTCVESDEIWKMKKAEDDAAYWQYIDSDEYRVNMEHSELTITELSDGYRMVSYRRYTVILDPDGWYNASMILNPLHLDFLEILHCKSVRELNRDFGIDENRLYTYHDTHDERAGYYIPRNALAVINRFIPQKDQMKLSDLSCALNEQRS